MQILVAYHEADRRAAEIVGTAMCRSFTVGQVRVAPYHSAKGPFEAAVLLRPGEAERDLLSTFRRDGRKALVLGKPADSIVRDLRMQPANDLLLADCPLTIRYANDHLLARCSPLPERPLWRFDFADEWNNLGFGRVALNEDEWSLAGRFEPDGMIPVAYLVGSAGESAGIYAGLHETADSAVLWYNRLVGPLDSLEWRVIEAFFGDYRPDELCCWPYLSEIPAGYRGAATMRLDCDEAVASARPLFELYAAAGLPLSLAVVTGLPMGAEDMRLLRDVRAAGGAIGSHSVHHWTDWGGNYSTALTEARASKAWLEETLPELGSVRSAVSPFHQNSPAAVQALADAGYTGFVGGIIRNDPEYLLGRAGRVPFVTKPMISHSQQCMLHGDCRPEAYPHSWENHLRGRAIFGYLDHPFSARYQYGWASEAERGRVHTALMDRIRSERDIWWANLDDCLGFLRMRDATVLSQTEDGEIRVKEADDCSLPRVAVMGKGRCLAA